MKHASLFPCVRTVTLAVLATLALAVHGSPPGFAQEVCPGSQTP